jgi:hypothetical protein
VSSNIEDSPQHATGLASAVKFNDEYPKKNDWPEIDPIAEKSDVFVEVYDEKIEGKGDRFSRRI